MCPVPLPILYYLVQKRVIYRYKRYLIEAKTVLCLKHKTESKIYCYSKCGKTNRLQSTTRNRYGANNKLQVEDDYISYVLSQINDNEHQRRICVALKLYF